MAIGFDKEQAAIPPGKHTGIIVQAQEDTRTFDPAKGPEPVVAVTIAPAWQKAPGVETLPVEITFSPKLNGISGLSEFLNRLGKHPKVGTAWEPSAIEGTEIAFESYTERGFVRVKKDTISALPVKRAK